MGASGERCGLSAGGFLLFVLALSACQCGSRAAGGIDGGDGGRLDAGLADAGTDGGVEGAPDSGTDGGWTAALDGGCGLVTCASAGANCGPIGDGCGQILECGKCPLPETCGGGGTPSVCGGKSGCIPRTCRAEGVSCGPMGDGCGGLLKCGSCTAPESCGGAGTPGVCGLTTAADGGRFAPDGGCLARSCSDQGIDCGPAGDGCGGLIDCGSCAAPEICGGSGKRDVCGVPPCTKLTCTQAKASCGYVGDGCGGVLSCGSCNPPDICGGGGVANQCGDANLQADAGPPCQGTLTISPPAATVTVQVTNGTVTAGTAQLSAIRSGCGPAETVGASWISNRPDVASVGTTGLVTAQGPRGGPVVITAGYRGLVATAQVTVVLAQTVYSGTSASAASWFGSSSSSGAPGFLYPLDKAMIPVNLLPLDFQWNPAANQNDVYRVTLTGSYGTLTAYVAPPTPLGEPAWQPDPATWSNFVESNVGRTVTLDLAESAGQNQPVFAAPGQSLTIAPSRMAGTVYYWAISAGNVLRLPAGSTTPQSFYTPPASPWGEQNDHCLACHTVSRDGTRMAAEAWDAADWNAGTILDLAQTPVTPLLTAGKHTWMWSAFDDTDAHLLTSWHGSLTLRDGRTGASESGTMGLPQIGCEQNSTCSHPAWSPDGRTVLFAKGLPGHFSYDVDFDQADLVTVPWNGSAFGTPSVLVLYNVDGRTLANFHPTFSIDNALVAFNRGPCSRSDGSGACPTTCPHASCGVPGNTPPGALEIVPADGGAPTELVRAEAGDQRNWYPNFSPFHEGGYHWLAFFSLRDYGWLTSGGARQVWIAAVDDSPKAGADPSHAPFWLPGQSTATQNDKAEWAKSPCVGQGQACQGDIDCCSGYLCRASAGGGSTCLPQAQACGLTGAECQSSSDCCAPLSCLDTGSCGIPCATAGLACQSQSDCCSGLGCIDGECRAAQCTSLTCAQQHFECGWQGDGCGNKIDCGGCDAGTCGGGGRPAVCGSPCVPLRCDDLGYDCGPSGDGCGGVLECGTCTAPQTCGGGGQPGVCGTGARCIPQTCADQKLSCGPAGDGCGKTIDCGGCDAGSCGGGGTPGVCGMPSCTPQTCQSLGFDCGLAGDGCGGLLDCGTCDAGTCGLSQPNVCGGGGFH